MAAMAEPLLGRQINRELLEAVVGLARKAIDRADGVGVTMAAPDGPTTAAATGDWVREIDAVQYGFADGPCLSAMATGRIVRAPDLSEESRWAPFVADAVRRGVAGMISAPISLPQGSIGALNVYSRIAGRFSAQDEAMVVLFADEVSSVLGTAQTSAAAAEATEHLQLALRSRETIGQAIGILMEREGYDAAEAFEVMRSSSQRSNVELREIARRIIESRHGAGFGSEEES